MLHIQNTNGNRKVLLNFNILWTKPLIFHTAHNEKKQTKKKPTTTKTWKLKIEIFVVLPTIFNDWLMIFWWINHPSSAAHRKWNIFKNPLFTLFPIQHQMFCWFPIPNGMEKTLSDWLFYCIIKLKKGFSTANGESQQSSLLKAPYKSSKPAHQITTGWTEHRTEQQYNIASRLLPMVFRWF